ncbi:unnamed protein product [Caenorhabditis nigoni]
METPVHHWIASPPTILGPKRINDIDISLKAHLLTKNIFIDNINQSNIDEISNIMAEHDLWYSLTTKIINTPRLSKSKLHTVKVNGTSLSDDIKDSFGVDTEHPQSLTVVDNEGRHYALEFIWLTDNEEEEILETDAEEEMIEYEEEELFLEYDEAFEEDDYEFRRYILVNFLYTQFYKFRILFYIICV